MLMVAILIGAILIMAGVNDTWEKLGGLTRDALWPAKGHGFLLWIFAILFLTALTRALNLPEAGKALIVLIVIAFLLGNKDIPGQVLNAVNASAPPSGSTQNAAPGK